MLISRFSLFIHQNQRFMLYSKLQKFLSSLLLFSMLGGLIFRVPFFEFKTFAWSSDFYNIVSIIIDEDTYNEVESEVKRYSEDIQWVLENTKVIILPTPKNSSAFDIASLNESLYLEWYKSLEDSINFESKLIWTVLIWDLNLPIAFMDNNSAKTVVPFTDFIDKAYIYNHETEYYEKNENNLYWLKSEIWHWVISPNLWDFDDNIKWFKDYFDKNHDFYSWTWNFKYSQWILNWDKRTGVPSNYEPFVFYYDQFREEKAINFNAYQSYLAYQNNKEDILYNRFDSELADNLSEFVLATWAEQISWMVEWLTDTINELWDEYPFWSPDADLLEWLSGINTPDTGGVSAISTRHIIENVTKTFLEVFSEWTIWDFRKDVHNAWRYNWVGWEVNVDLIPYFVTILDTTTDQIIKWANNDLEDEILNSCKWKGLIWGLVAATHVEVVEGLPKSAVEYYTGAPRNTKASCNKFLANWETLTRNSITINDNSVSLSCSSWESTESTDWSTATSWIEHFAISRWEFWGVLKVIGAEFNNDHVTLTIEADNWLGVKKKIQNEAFAYILDEYSSTYTNFFYWLQWKDVTKPEDCSIYRWSTENWWTLVEANRWYNVNNTVPDLEKVLECEDEPPAIYNWYWAWNTPLNLTVNNDSELVLQSNDLTRSITPLFDLKWSKKVTDASKTAISCDCCKTNYLKTYQPVSNVGDKEYQVPINWDPAINWFCDTVNEKYDSIPASHWTWNFPAIKTLIWSQNLWTALDCLTDWIEIFVGWASVDKSTYSWGECKFVKYKYYFKGVNSDMLHCSPTSEELTTQVNNPSTPNLPIDKDRYLVFKWKSAELGTWKEIIKFPYLFRLDLSSDWKFDLEKARKILGDFLDNYDASWKYDFKLKDFLLSQPKTVITIWWEEKLVDYFDFLAFSIYWNNLGSISGKYGFMIEYYLSDQFWWNPFEFILPKNKKEYEISYLWADWDAQNMYIKMDPNWKADNLYWDVISSNSNLWAELLWSNIWWWNAWGWTWGWDWEVENPEGLFKCAPPDWVPIREWIPAVICRLKEMMPPTISFWDWDCWPSLLNDSENYLDIIYWWIDGWTSSWWPNDDNSWLDDESLECRWDLNTNWINDCLEEKLWDNSSLDFYSDSEKYFYDKRADLIAVIKDKEWNIVRLADWIKVNFELIKIEAINNEDLEFSNTNKRIVFDVNNPSLNDEWIIWDYVNFNDLSIRTVWWIAKYWIWLRATDSNIFLKANFRLEDSSDEELVFVESELIEIKIRGDRLFNSSYIIDNSKDETEIFSWVNSLKVSDKVNVFLSDWVNNTINNLSWLISESSNSKEKLVLLLDNISSLWVSKDISYPLNVVLLNWDEVVTETSIEENELSSFVWLFSIKKSWSYSIEITDNEWFKSVKRIELLSDTPNSIDINLWTSIMEVGWSVSTNFAVLRDEYNNVISWEFYNINFELDWDSVEFLDRENNNFSSTIFEWYKIFRLKSTNIEWNSRINITITNIDDEIVTDWLVDIRVLEEINFIATLDWNQPKVWWETYKYRLSLRDSSWSIINNFNSRVYMIANPIFLESSAPYVELVNWIAEIEFTTKTVAWQYVPIEFQVEWLNKIVKRNIAILPESPMKMDLVLSKNKIEASPLASSFLSVELKDRYNNLVFNDSSTNTSIEILPEYSDIITSDESSSVVKEWKAIYKIYGTELPGIAYFKIWTDPSLSVNSFTVQDENWDVIISWIWENARKIETFYFWNDEKIKSKNYNSIYTTLLGSNYWDISEKNYLAGSLLFDRDNRSLAVTSLLNNSYKHNNVLKLEKSGWLQSIYSANDLTQDIEISTLFIDDKLAFEVFNKALNIYVWKIFYKFGDDTELIACESSDNECFDDEITSILLKPVSDLYNSYKIDDKLVLRDNDGNDIIKIFDDWTIDLGSSLTLEIDENNFWEDLYVNIKKSWNIIAVLWYRFKDSNISISRDKDIFDSKIENLDNSIIVLLSTNSYSAYNSWNKDNQSKIFYYNDPFDSEYALDPFSEWNMDSYENFVSKNWIGWKDWNKSLLSFAAWKTVWESVADHMSFWVINLWDPVISLKKIKKQLPWTTIDRNFDSSIWKLLSTDEDIVWYEIFDYDNDDKTDILLIKNDNKLKLLENKDVHSEILDKWNLAHIIDLGAIDLLHTWNFTGDWYDDIFFVNDEWEPFLLNNIEKDFTRFSLVDNFQLAWKIVRAEVFDMDNDTIDDIVTLDELGVINIFYWTNNSIVPYFNKYKVSEEDWINLNNEVRNDNALIYFDWLHQPSDIVSDRDPIDNYIFVKYPYSVSQIEVDYEAILNWEEELPDEIGSNYFIKSEFSETTWIKVEKYILDINWEYVLSGDIISTEIILTNTSWWRLDNIAFAEKLPSAFLFDESSLETEWEVWTQRGNLWYDFLLDWISLSAWESITITYQSQLRAIKHSYIKLWLFERDEPENDDLFWDIVIKVNDEYCWDTVDIYRSSDENGWKPYVLWRKTPVCDEDKIALPDELEQNTIDEDWNWVPDYIDLLSNTDSPTASQEYANEQLAAMNVDSDNDWIPDPEDNFEMDWNILSDLWEAWENIDAALDDIQDFLNWISCWFGSASCFASPMNWAPLAPGNDPVFMGYLIWDWLWVEEWMPIFSSLTWIQTSKWCFPSVWPVSPLGYVPWPTCGLPSAWGYLWTWAPTNTFRLFVSPTLTWGIWTAMCFGWPATVVWNSVPIMLSPLLPGWNCIVLAMPLFWCEDDWSDWDPRSLWCPNCSWWRDASRWVDVPWGFGVINWNCSSLPWDNLAPSDESLIDYLERTQGGSVDELFEFVPENFSEKSNVPLFTNSDWWNVSVELDLSSYLDWNFDDIIKIQQTRITPFPSWLMDWVTRQIEEIANKLTDFPTVFIILPDFSWIFDWNWWKLSWNDEELNNSNSGLDENLSSIDFVNTWYKKINSWIKEAYEFIGSTPLIKIEQETVNISIPWLSASEINSTIIQREWTLAEWEAELVDMINPNVEMYWLISKLRQNLDIIKEYKQIPEDINNLINKKQDYLEQILCNIESISYVLWGRIWKNWERFKAWVELYILIKAILKSWQMLVDIFLDYEAECHECKNERHDALDWEFFLISMLIPSIPVIRFPKWPDIIIDLHNIRVWLTIALPEFNISTKPILLPSLPDLNLPNTDFTINFDIPLLPRIEIPVLPDLPSLPKIELPDLPPPPKLPKLLSAIEVIVDIIKLITKAMCILKFSPLHPEWRAWDQIAFLTERNWYLWTDFFNISIPEFSFPFIDSIKITTYVNLEFETDFIVELARQIALPINAFTNDFTNIFDIEIDTLDFWDALDNVPNDITIWSDWAYNKSNTLELLFAKKVSNDIKYFVWVLDEWKDVTVSNLEFKKLINKSLASKSITSNPKLDKVREVWKQVNNLTYSKENSLIKELQDNNREKFEVLSDILNTEIIENKELKKKLNNIWETPIITKVWFDNKINLYNEKLTKYNDDFVESAKKLINSWDYIRNDLKDVWDKLIDSIKTPLQNYSDWLESNINKKILEINTFEDNELIERAQWDVVITSENDSEELTSCQQQANSDTKYNYEWIYILEADTSYRLFDYLDDLYWDEVITMLDFDWDDDDDLLYLANWQLFFKENLRNKASKVYVSTNPIIHDISDNKFYNWDIFYEAINNASELWSDNLAINLWFSAPTNKDITDFRIWFYTIIDKYLNVWDSNYRPEYIEKYIVDAFVWIDKKTIFIENELYTARNNISYIKTVWNLPWIKLKTKSLINIKDNILSQEIVNVTSGTSLYAWGSSFTIEYFIEDENNIELLEVEEYTNIKFKNTISIKWISWDAYIKWTLDEFYEWIEIRDYIGLPLFEDSKITYDGISNNIKYIELWYYNDTELSIDFSETKSWEMYDLWYASSDYFVRLSWDNDYYYAKISSIKDGIVWTLSKQILLAPQKEADEYAPELTLIPIRIPVYQEVSIDITPYVYEDWWIKNISTVIVDLDLENDTDGNWNSKDDDDWNIEWIYKDKVKVDKNIRTLILTFWEFETIFKKNIWITLIDTNGNVWYSEVSLEVYPPIPQIEEHIEWTINWIINEELSNEPVDIYRFRWWTISKLEDVNWLTKTLTNLWDYSFTHSEEWIWLTLSNDSWEIISINEQTWKITFKDPSLTSKVLSSNNLLNNYAFPSIIIMDWLEEIFYEYIQIEWVNKVKLVDNFEDIEEKWIYFSLTNRENYTIATIPEWLDFNPWALSIYRWNIQNDELFTIFIDWRINTLNDKYKLEYDSYWDYIVIKLIDSHFNREVWKVLFIIDSEYMLK